MLGQVRATMDQANHMELVLGNKTRSAGQFDIWEAVYSPQGEDGYPKRLYDKQTGVTRPMFEPADNYALWPIFRKASCH